MGKTLISLQSLAKSLGINSRILRQSLKIADVKWVIAVPSGENAVDKQLKLKNASRKCVPAEDVGKIKKMGLQNVVFPNGETIRQAIVDHALDTERKFDAFRHLHPELGFPCATTVALMVKQHDGWDWRIRKATVQYWAALAPSLAKNGVLPSSTELKKQGFNGLVQAMNRHPALFKGLRLNRSAKSPEQWVPVAERIADEHGGTLPGKGWLQKNKNAALCRAMSIAPSLFQHIPQTSHYADVDDHVATAKLLEQKYGRVPHYVWLVKNGYNKMYQAKRKHPQLFKGIAFGQEKLLDDVKRAKRVALAEKLAKGHGGKLPSQNWLRTHKHGKIAGCIQRFPELFKHIPQEVGKRLRTVAEWIEFAESLAQKHNGKIPSYTWLYAHHYSGLTRIMKLHPQKFQHLQQRRQN